MRGLEPPTPRITTWCSSQLSYIHHKTLYLAKNAFFAMLKAAFYAFTQKCQEISGQYA